MSFSRFWYHRVYRRFLHSRESNPQVQHSVPQACGAGPKGKLTTQVKTRPLMRYRGLLKSAAAFGRQIAPVF